VSPLPHVLRPLDQLAEPALVRKTGRDALDRAVRGLASVAVLVVDLDDFEGVNRSLGHEAGNRLLRVLRTTRRFRGPENTVALL
jgi:GGDEF domain-containing protein